VTRSRRRGGPSSSRVLLWVAAVVVAIWLVAPTLVVIPMSLTSQRSYRFPPPGWSLRWYRRFFDDQDWLAALGTSLLIAVLVAMLATVIGTMASFALVRGRFRGRGLATGFLLSPMVVPVVVTAVGVYLVFLRRHLVGNVTGLVLAHLVLALPFVVITVRAGLQTFDRTLERAAASLGAPPLATFRTVTLPLIRPALLTGALFAFITSFDELVVSTFLVDPDTRTLPVEMFTSVARESDPTVAVAATVMLVLTTLVLLATAVFSRKVRVDG
jgi:putative spermidine/putrescine transport system permease protein